MHSELDHFTSLVERALDKVRASRALDCRNSLEEAHDLLIQLHTSCGCSDPLRRVAREYRNCHQDLERAELLYSSGYHPTELSSVLGISSRRVYQLLRLARLPSQLKAQIRSSGLSERKLRSTLKVEKKVPLAP